LLIRYFIASILTSIIEVVLFTFIYYLILQDLFVSSIVSFIFATSINFILSKKYVFHTSNNKERIKQFAKTFVLSILSMFLGVWILTVLVNYLIINIIIAKIFSLFISFFINYCGRKYLIFND